MSQRHTDKDKDEKKDTRRGPRQKTTPKKKRDDEDSEVPSTRSATKKDTHSGPRQKTTPKKNRDDEDSEVPSSPSTRSATKKGNLVFLIKNLFKCLNEFIIKPFYLMFIKLVYNETIFIKHFY